MVVKQNQAEVAELADAAVSKTAEGEGPTPGSTPGLGTTHDTPEAAIETAVRANAHLICDCRQPPECPRVAAVLAAILAELRPGWCGHEDREVCAIHQSEQRADGYAEGRQEQEAEIERLRAALAEDESMGTEIARLRAALEGLTGEFVDEMPDADDADEVEWLTDLGSLRRARAALAQAGGQ